MRNVKYKNDVLWVYICHDMICCNFCTKNVAMSIVVYKMQAKRCLLSIVQLPPGSGWLNASSDFKTRAYQIDIGSFTT